jgi:pimeloyl-ACP methyl ester carboxylesterase
MEVESRGFRIHYLAAGNGPTLLLVPGILQSAGRWRDLRYFDALAGDFRVLAVDPLGHGESDKPAEPESYTEPEVVDDLIAVLDRDQAERAHVWGYSRGAHHAFLLAKLHPQRVLTLTAGGYSPTAAPGRRGGLLVIASALRSGDWERALDLLGVDDEGTRAVLKDNDGGALAGALEMTFMEEVHLSQVRMPVLLYAGSEEPFVEQVRRDAAKLRARFEALEGKGHTAAFQASDAVLPMVLDHLGLNSQT